MNKKTKIKSVIDYVIKQILNNKDDREYYESIKYTYKLSDKEVSNVLIEFYSFHESRLKRNILAKNKEEQNIDSILYQIDEILEYGCSLSLQNMKIKLVNLDGLGAVFFNDELIASASEKLFPLNSLQGDLCWGYEMGSSTIRTAKVLLNQSLYDFNSEDIFYEEMASEFAENFLVLYMQNEEANIEENRIVKWIQQYYKNQKTINNDNIIEEEFSFRTEYNQAMISILSYFSEVIQNKYPDLNINLRVENDTNRNKIILHIITPNGKKEIIEKTFLTYSMVVSNKADISELFDDKLSRYKLENKLALLESEIKCKNNELKLKDELYGDKIQSLNNNVKHLEYRIDDLKLQLHEEISNKKTFQKLLVSSQSDNNLVLKEHISIIKILTKKNKNYEKEINFLIKKLHKNQINESIKKEILDSISTMKKDINFFNEVINYLKNTVYGVSGNVVYQYLTTFIK